jgi:hypothetical protein
MITGFRIQDSGVPGFRIQEFRSSRSSGVPGVAGVQEEDE